MTKDRKLNLIIACIAASKLNEKDKSELIGFMQGAYKNKKRSAVLDIDQAHSVNGR